jgi:hypothetical protein
MAFPGAARAGQAGPFELMDLAKEVGCARYMRVRGQQIHAAVAAALLAVYTPAGVQAALAAAQRLEAEHDAALAQARMAVEPARYEATRAERRYRAVDPREPSGCSWPRAGVGGAVPGGGGC